MRLNTIDRGAGGDAERRHGLPTPRAPEQTAGLYADGKSRASRPWPGRWRRTASLSAETHGSARGSRLHRDEIGMSAGPVVRTTAADHIGSQA